MRTIKWADDYNVGILEIDEEHRALADGLNTLFSICDNGCADSLIIDSLENLLTQTQRHFAHEEAIMRKVGYPGHDDHRAQHGNLVAEMEQIIEKYKSGVTSDLNAETMQLLEDWLLHHILIEDKKIGRHTGAID